MAYTKFAQTGNTTGANLGFETKLWAAADKLRGHMDASEYKHVERDNRRVKGVLPKDYARPSLDKQRLGELIDLIMSFLDEFVQRYYVVEPQTIKKSYSITFGYRPTTQKELKGQQIKKRQSINFTFNTVQPSRMEIESLVKVWVQTHEV